MSYYCPECDKTFTEEEANYILVDNIFTVPYGDTFTSGGSIDKVAICVECDEELEEIK